MIYYNHFPKGFLVRQIVFELLVAEYVCVQTVIWRQRNNKQLD